MLIFVADSSFAAIALLKPVSDTDATSLIARLRLDAALYDEAPARGPGQVGRPRLKGKRRPTLQAIAEAAATVWMQMKIADWYGDWTRQAAWYKQERPTFSDAIALVRRRLWQQENLSTSVTEVDVIKISRALFDRLTPAVCYAA